MDHDYSVFCSCNQCQAIGWSHIEDLSEEERSMENITYSDWDPLSRAERDAVQQANAPIYRTRTPQERADTLNALPMRPGETEAMRARSVWLVRQGVL